jgi:hypothetical protein
VQIFLTIGCHNKYDYYFYIWQEDRSIVYKLLPVLASVVILVLESRGLTTILHRHRFQTPWRARPFYLYPPGTGWPSYTPRHWDPFSSPPTTRRATVEVFEPTSKRGFLELIYSSLSYRPGKDRTENFAFIIVFSLVTGETTRPQVCYLATDVAVFTQLLLGNGPITL